MIKTYFRFAIAMPHGGTRYRSLVSLGDELEARQQLIAEHDGACDEVIADRAHVVYALPEEVNVVPLDLGQKRTCWSTPRIDAIAFGVTQHVPDANYSSHHNRCFCMLLKSDMTHQEMLSLLLYDAAEATDMGWKDVGRIKRLVIRFQLWRWLKWAQRQRLVVRSGEEYALVPIMRDGEEYAFRTMLHHGGS